MINRIGRYEIQAELGRGGFGRVFRAYDPTVGRLVAIKTLNASGEQEMLTRFRNEATAAGRLYHPNIVTVFDFGEHDGSPFLVMELLDGEDIERIITNRRPLALLKRLDVMVQSAAGLHHAHSKGTVHRDVKPANIMLLASGAVKILDFGIALLTQATADRITPQGSLIGTLPYMAPEQFFGAGSSVMTDIFAYGVTCYKLLTGVHPFQAAELGALMHNIANLQAAPVRTLNPDCPEALEQVINKLLAKNPEARYQSLEDVGFDLEPIILDLRKENVGKLLAETRNLLAADQLEAAQSIIRQVIEIDPGNRSARELREGVQRQLKERAVRPRVTALVNAGREQLVVRKFDEAILSFESALRLDNSNPELHRLIEQTRAAAERARRADRLLEDARQALRRDDVTAAHENIAEAVATDPENAHAGALLSDVQKRLEQRRREQRFQDGLNHLRGLMLRQNFAEAIESGTRLQIESPDSTEVRQTLERAQRELEAQARREQLQAAIAESNELLKNRRFQDVVDRSAHLQTQFPESAELRDLASYAAGELQAERRAQAIAQATMETRSLVAAGNFDAALDRLHRALSEDPGLTALRELLQSVASGKSAHQRKVALQDALSKAAALTGEGRFSEAIERLDAFVRAYGENSALVPLRTQAEEGLERRRTAAAARKLMQEAQTFQDEGQPGPATQGLQRGTDENNLRAEIGEVRRQAESLLSQGKQDKGVSIAARPADPRKPGLSPRTWLAGGIGAAGLAAGIAFYEVRPSPAPPPITTVPVEIHTDPSGASVLIGSRSCVAPGCRFDLTPGRYQVEARMNGYQPLRQPLNVEMAKGTHVMDLTLQPLPPPPADDKTAGTGILVIHAGAPGALVYVDGSARNRTDESGSITLPLEAKTHEVRVELNGYEKPAARKVNITTGSQQVVNFNLILEAARLELRGAPAGVEVRVGGRLLGKTDGSASIVFPPDVGTGDQVLQLTLGAANRSIRQKFSAGQTLRLDWRDVGLSPSQLNADAIENQDWDRVRSSPDASQLRGYLASHPTGAHGREAASRLADLAWSAVDQGNIESVRKFARDNPENAHSKSEARKILDQYDAEQQRVAQERARQEQAKLDQGKQEQLKKDLARIEQERAGFEQSRKQQVLNTLRQLDTALQRKRPSDVKAIWPSASKTFFESLRSGQVEMTLSAEDVRFSQAADQAVAVCDLVTRTKTSSAPPTHHRGTVTLRNNGGNWIIESAKLD